MGWDSEGKMRASEIKRKRDSEKHRDGIHVNFRLTLCQFFGAIFTGLSSSIVACAVLLYIASQTHTLTNHVSDPIGGE